jgi:hypothetical protein
MKDVASGKIKDSDNTCGCGKCFYCFMKEDHYHTNNLEELRNPELNICLAEYVGPENEAL